MLDVNQHWASDLLPGAALGYYTAKKIESMQTRKSTQAYRESSNFAFFPKFSGETFHFYVLTVFNPEFAIGFGILV